MQKYKLGFQGVAILESVFLAKLKEGVLRNRNFRDIILLQAFRIVRMVILAFIHDEFAHT